MEEHGTWLQVQLLICPDVIVSNYFSFFILATSRIRYVHSQKKKKKRDIFSKKKIIVFVLFNLLIGIMSSSKKKKEKKKGL